MSSTGDYVISLSNCEFEIRTSKGKSYARLKADYFHNIPNETTIQK